jgi:hypothetical protein
MTIEYLDPRAEPGLPVAPYDLNIDLSEPGLMVGLLANGFPDPMNFLTEVGRVLKKRLPGILVQTFDKGNASIVAGEPLLNAMADDGIHTTTALWLSDSLNRSLDNIILGFAADIHKMRAVSRHSYNYL